MSKELEALDFVLKHAEFNDETPNKDLMDALNEIHIALIRLSAIENAEPSEAMKAFEELGSLWIYFHENHIEPDDMMELKELNPDWWEEIKSALLRAEQDRKELEELKKKTARYFELHTDWQCGKDSPEKKEERLALKKELVALCEGATK